MKIINLKGSLKFLIKGIRAPKTYNPPRSPILNIIEIIPAIIENKILACITWGLDTKASTIDKTISAENNAKWDSFAHILILMEVEKKFDITIPVRFFPLLTSFEQYYIFMQMMCISYSYDETYEALKTK